MWVPACAGAVGPHPDPHPCRVQPGEIARLYRERLGHAGFPGRLRLLHFLERVGSDRAAQPRQVAGHAAIGEIRNQLDVRPLLEQRDELVVYVFVPDAVREHIDAGTQQPLRILESKDVGGDAELVLVGLVDDRSIHGRRQLLVLAVSIVDPDLDQVDFSGRQLLHGLSTFGFAVDPIRDVGSSRLGPRDAAARGEISRGIRNRLCPHLEWHVA